MVEYYKILHHYNTEKKHIKIGIAGKYLKTPDTYLSIIRAIESAAFVNNVIADIMWIDVENFNEGAIEEVNGFIVPGGFGSRGIDGKLMILKYCRENKIPVLGICLGMQLMVIDCVNSIDNCDKYSSAEFNDNKEYIIDLQKNQNQNESLGGTMRLGNYTTKLLINSQAYELYGKQYITERHRHRYEVNNKYLDIVESSGLIIAGMDNDSDLIEIIEMDQNIHPYYIGCQYHPEFTSTYSKPNPLFVGLIKKILCNI